MKTTHVKELVNKYFIQNYEKWCIINQPLMSHIFANSSQIQAISETVFF